MDRDVTAFRVVVADIADVNAVPRRAGAYRDRLPILNFGSRHANATGDRSLRVERHQHRLTGIVVGPEAARRTLARCDSTAFHQLGNSDQCARYLTRRRLAQSLLVRSG